LQTGTCGLCLIALGIGFDPFDLLAKQTAGRIDLINPDARRGDGRAS